ncbi:methylcobalamin:coenzyme M methyltransferase [Limihaloglobus sulfuriphilus]|uniref:Methylcobalamin:coenzyme M methyltransferase n=1 Tax=Limihaloglobus sulfuriphilus TaxID=1851148 RepID=A0A1Q2MGB9_9BACT|nr:uroporphyrinogen decarboxylase family protein [Limihaloglobus sulfuriphilus]AQQ71689.1 methylcobalamin:coenzyme M methyltransferase [Limihaloglobus sulfuriphilus]
MDNLKEQRIVASLTGGEIDRIPVMPKIWVDFSAKVTGTDIREVIENPVTALDVIARAGQQLDFDAVRQFPFPAKKIIKEDAKLFEVDNRNKKIGVIDLQGGLSTLLFESEDYNINDPVMMSYFQFYKPSIPPVRSKQDAENIAVPDAKIFDELKWYSNQKEVMDRYPQLCYVADCNSATMSFYVVLRGIENAMFDLIENPGLVHAVMEKGAAIAIQRGKYWLDKGFRVLRLNDSTGNLSLISAGHWREFIYPHIKDVCDELHSYNKDALIYCHICGDILDIAEDLVETGLDCIGPLDPLGGFTVKQIRNRVGSDIALMGGVDTLSLLNKKPQEIKAEAVDCIEQGGENGRYILSSGCVVPRDCSESNIKAMVDAAKTYLTRKGD